MSLPGVGGRLYPAAFLAERAAALDARPAAAWHRWWSDVARVCGPATGARDVFDLVAMPLCARLGYRARALARQGDTLTARLLTPRGQPVALLVHGWRGWTLRPPAVWRDIAGVAREQHAAWALVVAPPHVSLLPARGDAGHRALELTFPDALEGPGIALLTTLLHAGAMDAGVPQRWTSDAAAFHARVHAGLQAGVDTALASLTRVLRRQARHAPAAFDEALTLVYRLLFLLFAESRALVPIHHPLFRASYTLGSLLDAVRRNDTRGLWEAFAAITSLARTGGAVESLRIFPFNGRLFARDSAPMLEPSRRSGRQTPLSQRRDAALAEAILAVATRPDPAGQLLVHYADLGVEQLGAVYERVLDLNPAIVGEAPVRRTPTRQHSAARKDTGTFYTPQALADMTVRLTLAPLVEDASADRLLELRIVDPAMGSGAFLVAALHYMADAYEHALVREGRHAPLEIDDRLRADFRRLIAQRCLYGVDANPTAVGVARLSLWLATLARDKPLSFLDHRLRVGNSLVGATPDVVRRSQEAVAHETPLLDVLDADLQHAMHHRASSMYGLSIEPDDSIDVVRRKERRWAALAGQADRHDRWRDAADLWCARWFWPGARTPSAAEFRAAIHQRLDEVSLLPEARYEEWISHARTAAHHHQFFHWPLEFADAFYHPDGRARLDAGFDAVIGNPPWETLRQDAQSARRSGTRDPLAAFIREAGLYPQCRHGHINLHLPFVERALQLVNNRGRIGLVLPWGMAVDDGAAELRRTLVTSGALHTVVGFDNARGLFPIHRGIRFGVVIADSRARHRTQRTVRLRTGLTQVPEDAEAEAPPLVLGHSELLETGGAGVRWPDLRRPDDLALLRHLAAFRSAGAPGGWALRVGRELNASDDRDFWQPAANAAWARDGYPVVEGKHITPFRTNIDRTGHIADPERVRRRFSDGRCDRAKLAYRDVSAVGNTHALIAAVLPAGVVTTHTLFCVQNLLTHEQHHYLCGLFNSRILNRYVRMFMSGHVTTGLIAMLPLPDWRADPRQRCIARLAERLSTGPSAALEAELNTLIEADYGLTTAV